MGFNSGFKGLRKQNKEKHKQKNSVSYIFHAPILHTQQLLPTYSLWSTVDPR